MAITQFAMVEELAFLVKDNLPSKHLILSMEETFLNFLQDETSLDGILELKPMDSYNRLLLHRLADIFGFAHVSVGEGVNRHLVLERCPESSIPSILVSDILWEYDVDEPQMSTIPHQLLKRKEENSSVSSSTKLPPHRSLEEREAAYLAVRERIFMMHMGEDSEPVKPKPRCNPVVARRMIAHALGQRINSFPEDTTNHCKEQGGEVNNAYIQAKDSKEPDSTVKAVSKTISQSDQCVNSKNEVVQNGNLIVPSARGSNDAKVKADKSSPEASRASNEYLKREHLGAAKRMFLQALGKPCRKNESLR